jgi:hypothetical protein
VGNAAIGVVLTSPSEGALPPSDGSLCDPASPDGEGFDGLSVAVAAASASARGVFASVISLAALAISVWFSPDAMGTVHTTIIPISSATRLRFAKYFLPSECSLKFFISLPLNNFPLTTRPAPTRGSMAQSKRQETSACLPQSFQFYHIFFSRNTHQNAVLEIAQI